MLEHIIKNGERIENIVDIYKVSIEELKLANMHISDLKNVVPGMKIKVPLISEEIEQILDKTESFVMNYYPLVTKEINKNNLFTPITSNHYHCTTKLLILKFY